MLLWKPSCSASWPSGPVRLETNGSRVGLGKDMVPCPTCIRRLPGQPWPDCSAVSCTHLSRAAGFIARSSGACEGGSASGVWTYLR